MWCEHCRQNVTGMVSQTLDSVCCSRCGRALPGSLPESSQVKPVCLDGHPLENWDFDEELRHIERLLRRDGPRWDVPPLHLDQTPHLNRTSTAPTVTTLAATWRTRLQAGIAGVLLCVGLAATACGLILIVWRYWGDRAELLIPGLVVLAAGQFTLLSGFTIQPNTVSSAAPPASEVEGALPPKPWLDMHRRIDAMLRADLPGERKAS